MNLSGLGAIGEWGQKKVTYLTRLRKNLGHHGERKLSSIGCGVIIATGSWRIRVFSLLPTQKAGGEKGLLTREIAAFFPPGRKTLAPTGWTLLETSEEVSRGGPVEGDAGTPERGGKLVLSSYRICRRF